MTVKEAQKVTLKFLVAQAADLESFLAEDPADPLADLLQVKLEKLHQSIANLKEVQ